jgi:flavodoxin
MKTAVIYYSMSGNTRQTAEKIADAVGADLICIEPVKEYPSEGARKFIWGGMKAVMGETPRLKPYRFDGSYDRIVIGTPVWASSFAPPIRSFIKENREKLEGKPVAAFFCYSGGGADKAAEKLKKMLKISSFEAELVLVDPKDQPKPENDDAIAAFCEKFK